MSVCLNSLINTQVGYITRGMRVWDKRFFSDFFSSVLSKKTVFLGKLSNNTTRKMERTADRNKHFLEKESFRDFPSRVEKRCFSLVEAWGKITDDDFICMDEVDIAKPSAKAMEWLSLVRDGSTGNIVSGYVYHGASIRGIPVILEREDLNVDTKNQVWKGMMDRICSFARWEDGKPRWTFLLDAYYDIASYLDILHEKSCHYIIRAKRNRIWIDVRTGEERKLKDFNEWIHEVRLPGREYALYLHVKKYPEFQEPMRVLSSRKDIIVWTNDFCSLYFKRWEIEQVFKTMKQEFDLEKVRVQTLTVLDNTVAIIQLAVAFSNAVFNERVNMKTGERYQQKNDFRRTTLFVNMRQFEQLFSRFVWRNGLTMNRNSIVTFISETLKISYKYNKKKWWKKSPKKRGDPNPRDLAQMRLFTMKDLRKSGED